MEEEKGSDEFLPPMPPIPGQPYVDLTNQPLDEETRAFYSGSSTVHLNPLAILPNSLSTSSSSRLLGSSSGSSSSASSSSGSLLTPQDFFNNQSLYRQVKNTLYKLNVGLPVRASYEDQSLMNAIFTFSLELIDFLCKSSDPSYQSILGEQNTIKSMDDVIGRMNSLQNTGIVPPFMWTIAERLFSRKLAPLRFLEDIKHFNSANVIQQLQTLTQVIKVRYASEEQNLILEAMLNLFLIQRIYHIRDQVKPSDQPRNQTEESQTEQKQEEIPYAPLFGELSVREFLENPGLVLPQISFSYYDILPLEISYTVQIMKKIYKDLEQEGEQISVYVENFFQNQMKRYEMDGDEKRIPEERILTSYYHFMNQMKKKVVKLDITDNVVQLSIAYLSDLEQRPDYPSDEDYARTLTFYDFITIISDFVFRNNYMNIPQTLETIYKEHYDNTYTRIKRYLMNTYSFRPFSYEDFVNQFNDNFHLININHDQLHHINLKEYVWCFVLYQFLVEKYKKEHKALDANFLFQQTQPAPRDFPYNDEFFFRKLDMAFLGVRPEHVSLILQRYQKYKQIEEGMRNRGEGQSMSQAEEQALTESWAEVEKEHKEIAPFNRENYLRKQLLARRAGSSLGREFQARRHLIRTWQQRAEEEKESAKPLDASDTEIETEEEQENDEEPSAKRRRRFAKRYGARSTKNNSSLILTVRNIKRKICPKRSEAYFIERYLIPYCRHRLSLNHK